MLERPADPDLVSVIVPAYNAARTIDATLATALGQTYRHLEVIVVDDESEDATGSVVKRHAAVDPRLRYVFQPNGGVAAARNRGIAEARGAFIATLDADDLWYPSKIERQVERFRAAGPGTALVYAWCYWLAPEGALLGYAPPLRHEGWAFPQMCLGNLVVSASNALLRREAVLAVGGFDEALRKAEGQGCEDWKLYLQIAERHEIAAVPEYLVGYRLRPGAMSDDFVQMMRSRRLVESQFLPRHPGLAPQFAMGRAILARSLAMRAFQRREYGMAMQLLAGYPDPSPRVAWKSAGWLLLGAGRRLRRSLQADMARRG
ncbi:glycosyltransferase family 2 protein [Sphingomonas sp. PR090111-T3T-6A]|uniref:glycosyltransferase family 2 protein n=1 Tax=Sphingomonas sp. PR090111-T3T-6A TaxID=685778 RepID=UPI000381071D|nr:glycosyltransferase family 2 protein [Sphingomonas sp. PR090111-T3T-6A]